LFFEGKAERSGLSQASLVVAAVRGDLLTGSVRRGGRKGRGRGDTRGTIINSISCMRGKRERRKRGGGVGRSRKEME
jgi:hypothetical protein